MPTSLTAGVQENSPTTLKLLFDTVDVPKASDITYMREVKPVGTIVNAIVVPAGTAPVGESDWTAIDSVSANAKGATKSTHPNTAATRCLSDFISFNYTPELKTYQSSLGAHLASLRAERSKPESFPKVRP